MVFQCEQCGSEFKRLSDLKRHRRTQNHWKKYTCGCCKKTFNRKDNLDRHIKKHDNENFRQCPECLKVFVSETAINDHLHTAHSWGTEKRSAENQQGGGISKRQKIGQNEDPKDFYKITKISDRKIEKFRTTASYYKVTVNDLEVRELSNILKMLKKLFQSIIQNITENISSTDLVRVTMDNPELDFPIVLPFMRRSALTVDRLLSEIERVLQSYEQFVLDETFGIELVHVHMPAGKGRKKTPYVDISRLLKDKKSIIQIKNLDDLCCARALVTAVARIENHEQWENIRKGFHIQKILAIQLHEKANVPLKKCGIEDIKKFQAVLTRYQIHVLSKEHFNAIVYCGPEGGIPIYLYSHDEHYDVISKITGFLNRSYFCGKCKKGYNNEETHACNNPCQFCRHLHENTTEQWKYCSNCNCCFQNESCFNLHEKISPTGLSTCSQRYKCQSCGQMINTKLHKRTHKCGETYCKTCKDFVPEDHLCFMQPIETNDITTQLQKKKDKPMSYIFMDYECTQDDQLQCDQGYLPGPNTKCANCKKFMCGSFQHNPNLCIAHKVCGLCISNTITSESSCVSCGKNEQLFKGKTTNEDFCKWLFSEENVGATVICHNFKGYDSYPILKYLHENAILPEVITTGSKYMSIKVPICKIRMIDSLNFIPMPLADMPKAFGETELTKGFFPHLYNRKENQNKERDCLPEISYYSPNNMKPDMRKQFLSWYDQNKNNTFRLQEELVKYCRSDVDILRKCCLRFRQMFMALTKKEGCEGVDPFENCITIASACNLVYRRNFLDPENIAIIPPHGYRPQEKQSLIAYQWLSYLAYSKNVYIQHGRNTGEKQIGPYKVDGYFEKHGEKNVLEFHGCFWHGCTRCYSQSTINPVTESTMADLYAKTMEKKHYLEGEGYIYHSLWECDFRRELASNTAMQAYIQKMDIVTPLEPRSAFYGGRTEAFKLYEKASEAKNIKYYDVTSLYPYINKTGKIPVGHPMIITENFEHIDEYEGLVKCKILPPRGLHIPVLPYKCNGKLIFGLCKTCAEHGQQTICEHCDDERAFLGTWVTDEVKTAIEEGYTLLKIYEIWHFPVISQYDTKSKAGGIFTNYVNTFLKVKQEASGWPIWALTEEDKRRYIEQYHDKEGIMLDYDKIKQNPGLRSLAKLMLNSFWGKFGQRSNLTQTTYTEDPIEFIDMLTSDQQQIKNVQFVSDHAVQLDWAYNDDFVEASSRTNVVIAAYTTAQARLKLYSYLKPLGNRTLYCDTDSIVFTSCPGEWEPPLGVFLGDLTDETPDNKITAFVTGGPKNYAYNLLNPDKKGQTSICKVRGITLNYQNTLDIHFDTIMHLIKGDSEKECVKVIDNNKICRANGCIITRTETKDYKLVFDKRVIKDKFFTFPYGM